MLSFCQSTHTREGTSGPSVSPGPAPTQPLTAAPMDLWVERDLARGRASSQRRGWPPLQKGQLFVEVSLCAWPAHLVQI